MIIETPNTETVEMTANCYLCRPENAELEELALDFTNPEAFEEAKKILNAENISLMYIPIPPFTVAIVNTDCIEDDSKYNLGIFGNPIFGNIIFAKVIPDEQNQTALVKGFENIAEMEAVLNVINSIKQAEREPIIDSEGNETPSIYEKFSTMPKKEFVEMYINRIENSDEDEDEENNEKQ